ncbi:hypothetical protein [Paraurantiacibacter namhicola]|uniref:DUF2975 domain-containing protein n=1 Tax=Paraurantiacibacter namhicola TaxID=645517 RepID=A0A1C7DAT7_9SPHN|nr:hypothetical protein [Paraurantiacibacter namhicola]ANU08610.1 hypothetical protein A6F65_02327 [Paraurantiacibacter namhicola]
MDGSKRYARLVALAAGGCTVLLALFLLLEATSLIGGWTQPGYWSFRRLSMIPYLLAVADIARASCKVSKGAALPDALPKMLRRVGALLALGGFMDLTGTSLLLMAIWPDRFSTIAHFDPSYLAVMVVGMMLWLVGRLAARAFVMAKELEEFV